MMRALALWAAACQAPVLLAAPLQQEAPAPWLSYVVRPVPRTDRTDLQVTLRFTGEADGTTVLDLPQDRYGTPDVHTSITALTAAGDAKLSAGDAARQRIVTHPPGALIEIAYTISWDPARSEGIAYSPSVSPDHFHFLGPQWMVLPQSRSKAVDLQVHFADLPDGLARPELVRHRPGA